MMPLQVSAFFLVKKHKQCELLIKENLMIKKILCTCVTAAVLAAAGKMVSDYAETKPSLKNVKDKLNKTGKDLADDCKDVLDAARRVFTGELPTENTIDTENC